MSSIPQLMSGRALEHGITMMVDHGGTNSAKMHVGGQANADVAAGATAGGATTEVDMTEYIIPAGSLVAGSTIRARYVVLVSAMAAGTDNLIVDLTLGASATGASNESVVVNTGFDVNSVNDISTGDVIIQIRTAGSGGTAVAWGQLSNPDSNGILAGVSYFKASFTVNTTVDNYLTVTGKWSNANANLCTTQGFVVDIVNPST